MANHDGDGLVVIVLEKEMKNENGFYTLLPILILLSLLLTVPAFGEVSAPDSDALPRLVLGWNGLPSRDSVASLTGSTLDLYAVSSDDETVEVTVELIVDAGGSHRAYRELPALEIVPGTTASWTVDLTTFGLENTIMDFSGQVRAVARVRQLDEAGSWQKGATLMPVMPIYYHRESTGLFLAYGETVLTDTFAGGDLYGTVSVPRGITPTRVTRDDGGRDEVPFFAEADGTPGATGGGPMPADLPITSGESRFCIKWDITVVDKGFILDDQNGNPFTEDYWHGLTQGDIEGIEDDTPDSFMRVTARGVKVAVVQGDWFGEYWAHPATGCFNFQPPDSSQPVTVIVVTRSKDKDDNITALLGAGIFPFGFVRTNVSLPPLGQSENLNFGNNTPRATVAAVAAFAAYRENYQLSNKQILFRETANCTVPGGNTSSAHFNVPIEFSTGVATLNIHVPGGTTPAGQGCDITDHREHKFIITHELGHAWLLLAWGVDETEPNVATSLNDPDENICLTPFAYSLGSLEFEAVGGREGIAHFYAAKIWNNTAQREAMFSLFAVPNSFEPSEEPGGRLVNICTAIKKCGRGTNYDWGRFWWDWHTPYSPGNTPETVDLRNVYVQALVNGGLTAENYYKKFKEALDDVGLSATLKANFAAAGAQNGAGDIPNCFVYNYPNCDCWWDRNNPIPESCLGEVGCPCTDVWPLPDATDLYKPQYIPDGAGSYLTNGINGPGQWCPDLEGETVCGALNLNGAEYPICQLCDEETNFGCSCENDTDCGGVLGDVQLRCHGATSDGWKGSQPGTCLPDEGAADGKGRDRLLDVPWFCLDNCGSKGNGFYCLYDQLRNAAPSIDLPHAQCVDVFNDAPAGYCEALPGGAFAPPSASCGPNNPGACCQDECDPQDPQMPTCQDWGYPDAWVCDKYSDIGVQYGHCVPPGCGVFDTYNEHPFFCEMFW